ncbi:hypothetical protein F4U02_07560 [Acinetobacter haemolyticus]|uniref:Uncharacterized protein n=2 Tax=Acinetobacter haemolyticus TaxID=29430 RepID=A0A514TGD3_ACIHA|nr:hypothetical protein [Acinetobacter haemolyticus]EFF81734.1 hypothetical protein HMP0015_2799 [Acinetobacter haemolyticus ATCC 19194]ENW21790.1 hypothetical protein F926_01083 [Acinetobacter haemolyticus NIPH 261]MBO3658344.1 hypothetical protein [Acinetobacter haemolyticus]MQZ30846.1 hypothetical protein [Acinetobacter haemolyticus]NAR88043.1 hypothetical protein [Acinetobacter haemolyticus]
MKIIFNGLFIIALFVTKQVHAQIEIPEKLILNKNDLYLKGNIKSLNTWTKQKFSPFKFDEVQIYFLPNGVLRQIDSPSMGSFGQEWEFDKKSSKLIKHHLYTNNQAMERNNYLIGSVTHYDKENRPQIIAYYPKISSNILSKKVTIEYTPTTQIYKHYSNTPNNNLQLMSVQTIQISSQNGELEKIILANAPPYHFMPPIEKLYNHNGLIKSSLQDMRENSKIEYQYENSVLSKILNYTHNDTNVSFKDYKFDDCGNWIQRNLLDNKNNDMGVEYRKLEYYSACIPNTFISSK